MNTLLLEAIYHRPELDEMDKCFEEILSLLPDKTFTNPRFKVNITKIEKILKKVFNVECRIFLHPMMNDRVTYGMRIFPSYEEMKGQYLDALEDEDKGFQLIDCHNVSIEMEGSFLNFLKKNGGTARMMSAVMIHEIGHKVYVRVQNQLYGKEGQTQGTAIAIGLGGIITGGVLSAVNPAIGLTAMLIAFLGTSSFMDFVATKYYSEREIYSDSLAVRYGYGNEMYQTLSLLQQEAKRNHTKNPVKFLDWLNKNLNYYYLRRKGVIDILRQELKEAQTDKEREYIRKMLNDLLAEQNKSFGEKTLLL
jgi:Peptidase family M48